eukprot:Pompholyxophrys_punicea_v1_NODE_377_length_2100_cov_32.452812.p2 type:complete len:101 gc:universal NODE_377_length_2100_cov_32.452812:624-926(+)
MVQLHVQKRQYLENFHNFPQYRLNTSWLHSLHLEQSVNWNFRLILRANKWQKGNEVSRESSPSFHSVQPQQHKICHPLNMFDIHLQKKDKELVEEKICKR